ncbi:MAG: hypothetical protein JKX72_09550 [Robiginitomaculum sp.]|nr:hypothetical protein [Robiginitomaculum sp.]
MMLTPHTWLQWAKRLMPLERAEWLTAMETELSNISDKVERKNFAIGCFKAAVHETVHSRRGLHYIARATGAFLTFIMSFTGIVMSLKLGAMPENVVESRLITGLCLLYMVAAGLFALSLRGLQIYAGIGLSVAVLGWVYCMIVHPKFETLSVKYLTALSVEASGFMAGLFLATIYLNWLYTPKANNA